MDLSWRCSEWKNSQLRRPVVSTKGYCLASSGAETGLAVGSLKCGSGSMPAESYMVQYSSMRPVVVLKPG